MRQIKKTKEFLDLIDFVIGLDKLGNTPYFTQGIVKKIKSHLENKQVTVSEDEFALYAKVGNPSKPLVIIDTHLDHPGFVIVQDNTVHSLGSFLNSKMINKINFPDKLPVGFYTSAGHFITSGFLYKITTSGNQIKAFYQTDQNLTLPANTQVMPIFQTGLSKDILSLRSVDNLATVMVCLMLIDKLKNRKDINLTIVFSKLEEIYQLTATGLSKRGSTPFEKIHPHTPTIVLEVAPVLTNKEAQNGDLAVATKENIFTTQDGKSKIFSHLKVACEESLVKLHYSTLNSHGDSISFRLVGGNTETICLHAGSFNRHNIDENGQFTAEFVYLKSLKNLVKVSTKLIEKISLDYPVPSSPVKLTPEESKKRKQLISAYTRAYPRLKFQKLYPKSILEFLYFAFFTLLAKFYSTK